MKEKSIETIIKNSNKEDISIQTDFQVPLTSKKMNEN